MAFKLSGSLNTPMFLLTPQTASSYGVKTKTYPEGENGELFYGTFRTFGGTDKDINGVYVVENTATIETYYRPDITADCHIYISNLGYYEIIGEPENISLRNQYLLFKIRRLNTNA